MPQRSVPGIDQRTSVPGAAETVGPETVVARCRGAAAAGHGSEQTSANAAVRTYAASRILTDPRFSNSRGSIASPLRMRRGSTKARVTGPSHAGRRSLTGAENSGLRNGACIVLSFARCASPRVRRIRPMGPVFASCWERSVGSRHGPLWRACTGEMTGVCSRLNIASKYSPGGLMGPDPTPQVLNIVINGVQVRP